MLAASLAILAGCGLLVYGLAMLSVPVALIVAGAGLIWGGLAVDVDRG